MAAAEAPLTLGELAATLATIGGFEPRPLIAVGVSGGPDSLALALLADCWARERGGVAWGLIVDHRLRPESATEAAKVAGWLAARGIPHTVLTWREPKPATGIQEAARTARYRLLAGWCAAQGCLHLFIAHHRDDQAETYLIRHRAKSGSDGLAGMAAVRELPGLRLVRPLLGVAKTQLAAFLDAEAQPYLRDPSNRNPAFERSRLRLEQAADLSKTLAEVSANASARIAREHALARLFAVAVVLHPAGFAAIDPAPVAAHALGEQALGRIAAVLGGAEYPVRRRRVERLRGALAEMPMRARTLGGCRFLPWRDRVLVLRETARAAPALLLAPGMAGIWDKRFAVRLPAAAAGPVTIGALGAAGVAALGRRLGERNPLPRLVYPALPAVWDDAGLVAVPHLSWRRPTAEHLPELAFRPTVSLFGAAFTVV